MANGNNVPIHLLAIEIRFSKYSIVSVFPNWLYSSERKPRNAEKFKIFENFEFYLSNSLRLYLHIPKQ